LVSELENARKEGIDMAQPATKLAVVPAMPLDSPETRPMHEEICALAYSLWQARVTLMEHLKKIGLGLKTQSLLNPAISQ